LVTSSGGELALACETEKSIVLFRADGQIHRVIHADADGEPLLPPQRVAFASDGSIFFTASRPLRSEGAPRGGLYWIPAGHKNAWSISSSLAFPQGLLIEKNLQHVVVAERMSGRVVRYMLHGSARSYNRRLRKPQILFDFKKSVGTGTDVLSPGPSALAWASDTSFWVSFIGDSTIREIRIEDGQVAQTVSLPSQATRVTHLHPDRIQKVLWLSTEKGLESVPIPANPNPASP
jgi:sugar lactone lactonase YvrE